MALGFKDKSSLVPYVSRPVLERSHVESTDIERTLPRLLSRRSLSSLDVLVSSESDDSVDLFGGETSFDSESSEEREDIGRVQVEVAMKHDGRLVCAHRTGTEKNPQRQSRRIAQGFSSCREIRWSNDRTDKESERCDIRLDVRDGEPSSEGVREVDS